MKLSARNVLKGKVIKITRGAVNAEVTLELAAGIQVVSIITNTSVDNLGLKEGKQAYAVVKASSVMIAVDSEYASDNTLILPGAILALIPPVSGG